MPKRKVDPLLECLHFFQGASLDAAKTALMICADVVQTRMLEAGEKPVVRKSHKRKPLSVVVGDQSAP